MTSSANERRRYIYVRHSVIGWGSFPVVYKQKILNEKLSRSRPNYFFSWLHVVRKHNNLYVGVFIIIVKGWLLNKLVSCSAIPVNNIILISIKT